MPRSSALRMMRMLSDSSFCMPMWKPPRPTIETLTPVLPSCRIGIVRAVTEAEGSGMVPSLGAPGCGPFGGSSFFSLALQAASATVAPRKERRARRFDMRALVQRACRRGPVRSRADHGP